MIVRLFFIAVCLALLSSCSTVAAFKTADSGDASFDATNAKDIKVYSVSDIGQEYQVIGQVVASADAGSNSEKAVNHLKKIAAKLGADAVVDLRLEISQGYWQNAIKATGTAVKFN